MSRRRLRAGLTCAWPGVMAALCGAAPAIGQVQPLPAPVAQAAAPAAAPDRRLEANLLLLDVQLDGHVLSDSLSAYQDGAQILLPLGELTRLLTLAISVQPQKGSAVGYVLTEDRRFALNVEQSMVQLGAREIGFEQRRARVIGDDIYVSSQLLSRWLPIDFVIDLPSLRLHVKPREQLPLQARLERERAAAFISRDKTRPVEDPGYPRQIAPYRMLDHPFIDQTLGADARSGRGSRESKASYTAYLTADILGMEGEAYYSTTRDKEDSRWRLTLGRNDPDAGLLGPLHARSFAVGSIQLPSVANLTSGSPVGKGIAFSNRRLDQPTSFDRQSLRGDLPPGWDVTLYYNEALIGFQPSGVDGLYAFDDLPLSFGRNDFVLSFNGPLGQTRVERRSFRLDQPLVAPGEMLYSFAQHRDDDGNTRLVAKSDVGLSKTFSAGVGFVRVPRTATVPSAITTVPGVTTGTVAALPGAPVPVVIGPERNYYQASLRGYFESFIASSEVSVAQNGGSLADFSVKTSVGDFAVDLQHIEVTGDFESDVFAANGDSVRRRSKGRVVGSLAFAGWVKLPVALEVQHEQLKSGATVDSASGRISAMLAGTAVTNALGWRNTDGTKIFQGNLQLSRRVAEMGLSANMGYSIKPESRVDTLAIAADRNLVNGLRVNAGLFRDISSGDTILSGGVSKNFGSYALAVNGSYSNRRELALGLQLFVALGRDPRTGRWFADAVPLAGSGALAARAFVDRNLNGVHDRGEEFVPNAGFIINSGGRHPDRTAADGTVLVKNLPPGRYADIALDSSTLEDPQWKPSTAGVRVLPRPGRVQMVDFPVVSTSDVDGTVYLLEKGVRRGIGDAVVELVDAKGAVAATTKSTSDGFYLLSQVVPGQYRLRISPQQSAKLRLALQNERAIEIKAEGDFLSGHDLVLIAAP